MDYTIATNTVAVGSGDTAPATGTPGEFTVGNPATNTPATVIPGYQLNALVQEIRNAIVGAGIAPDKTNNAQLLAAIKGLSFGGATVQDVTASRALGTVYTNSTSRTIAVMAGTANNSTTAWGLTGYVGGNPCQYAYIPASAAASIGVALIVPPGATYEISGSTGTPTLSKWIEVR